MTRVRVSRGEGVGRITLARPEKKNALDGGGTVSLMNDSQGKVLSTALLRLEIDVPEEVARAARGRGRMPRKGS